MVYSQLVFLFHPLGNLCRTLLSPKVSQKDVVLACTCSIERGLRIGRENRSIKFVSAMPITCGDCCCSKECNGEETTPKWFSKIGVAQKFLYHLNCHLFLCSQLTAMPQCPGVRLQMRGVGGHPWRLLRGLCGSLLGGRSGKIGESTGWFSRKFTRLFFEANCSLKCVV